MLGVRLLGGFRLWREQVLLPVKTQALRELLSYLILNNKPIRRETVAEDLWGEQTTGDACKKLRQQLWLLRSLLSEHHLSEFQLSEDENHDTLVNVLTVYFHIRAMTQHAFHHGSYFG